jgi:hypothetical protein
MVGNCTTLASNPDILRLMRRMHKSDPKLGPGGEDKRSIIPIKLEDVDLWRHANPNMLARSRNWRRVRRRAAHLIFATVLRYL